jgi:hypothetical protein
VDETRPDQPLEIPLGATNRGRHRLFCRSAELGLEPARELHRRLLGGAGVPDDAALADRAAAQLELRLAR